MSIELDHIETWPPKISELISSVTKLHENHEADEILRKKQKSERVYIPLRANAYKPDLEGVYDEIVCTLLGKTLVGYHASRLTDREINNVRTEGLKVLSEDLLAQKIANAIADGHISEERDSEFSNKNSADEKERHYLGILLNKG